jgi:hypothetical protein
VNPQVVLSLILVLVWLGLAVYFFFFLPRAELGGLDTRLAGVAALALMLWNLGRAYLAWRPARCKEPVDERWG